ncbi:hypothetical protein HDV05_003176 [Chytridiales sp. JEL 0842]|nr:hypothetical protein HDV05_003176 [Chytridiales sp. JEL 0842]
MKFTTAAIAFFALIAGATAQVPDFSKPCKVGTKDICAGSNYAQCAGGKWMIRPCPKPLTCKGNPGYVYCDHPTAPPPPMRREVEGFEGVEF